VKRKTRRWMVCGVVAVALGCAGTTQQRAQQALGGMLGAATAAGICAVAGGNAGQCVAAAAGGAAVGWAATAMAQGQFRKDRPLEKEALYYQSWDQERRMVVIRSMRVSPTRMANEGGVLTVETDYSLLAPPASAPEPVTQTFSVLRNGEELHTYEPMEAPRDPGGWVVKNEVPVPEGLDPGSYAVKQVLDARTRSPEVRQAMFTVAP